MITTLIAFTLLANSARVTPLTPSIDLSQRAQVRAEYLCEHNQWSHDGWQKSFEGVAEKWRGENLAKGFADATSTETAWMASPSHRANLLNPYYKQVGIGQACDITVELFTG